MTGDDARRDDSRKKGLGRGLSELLGEGGDADAGPGGDAPREVPIEMVVPNPDQPRRHFDEEELAALSNSIREKGVLQPILVRPHPKGDGTYQIVAGERRWRASQRAQLHTIPVIERTLDDAEVLELAIIENVQRADLNAIEEAAGYTRLIEQFEYTQEKLSRVIGKSRSHIANTLRLLALPQAIRGMVEDGSLTAGHARALITVPNAEKIAQTIVKKGLNVRDAERLAQRERKKAEGGEGARPARAEKDPDTRALEADLAAALGVKVQIGHRTGGEGTIQLSYESLDQLDEICRRLCQVPEPVAEF